MPFCGCSMGISDCYFHYLRNEATNSCFEKGLNPVDVATSTGHKETRVLQAFKSSGFGRDVGFVPGKVKIVGKHARSDIDGSM